MPRPKKPTPAQAQKIFEARCQAVLDRYRSMVAVKDDHPSLTSFWRSGYTVRQHRVTGHWVVRARHAKPRKGGRRG